MMWQPTSLLKRRFWTLLVQLLFFVMLVCSSGRITIDATDRRRPRTSEACPVRLRSNISGVTCVCSTTTISEIGCSGGIDTVPEFLRVPCLVPVETEHQRSRSGFVHKPTGQFSVLSPVSIQTQSLALRALHALRKRKPQRKRQPLGMLGRSSGNHGWLLANASDCV